MIIWTQPVALLEGSRTFNGWDLVEGHIGTPSSPALCFLSTTGWAVLLHHSFLPWWSILSHAHGNGTKQPWAETSETVGQNRSFFLFSCLSQVLCHSDITNTMNKQKTNHSINSNCPNIWNAIHKINEKLVDLFLWEVSIFRSSKHGSLGLLVHKGLCDNQISFVQ
jgi:hypothetical protein